MSVFKLGKTWEDSLDGFSEKDYVGDLYPARHFLHFFLKPKKLEVTTVGPST